MLTYNNLTECHLNIVVKYTTSQQAGEVLSGSSASLRSKLRSIYSFVLTSTQML